MPMQIQVTGRDVDVTDKMRAEIDQALRPVTRRLADFPEDMTQTDVVVERVGPANAWQVRVTLGAGSPDHTFVSTERADALAQAVRLAVDDVVDQIDRFREKVQRKEHTYSKIRTLKKRGG